MMCLTFKTVFSSHRTAYRRSDITWETRWARYHPLTHSSIIYSITLLKKCFCITTTAEINVLSDDSLRNTSQCVKQLWNVLIKDLQCQTHVSNIQKLCISSSSSNDINSGQTRVNGWTFSLSLCVCTSLHTLNKDSHWWRPRPYRPSAGASRGLPASGNRFESLALTWGKGSKTQWTQKTQRSLWETCRWETRDRRGKTSMCERLQS